MRILARIAAALLVCVGVVSVKAGCQLNKLADLPVTMNGGEPEIFAKINGQDTRFLVDSGAFWSVISPGAAKQFSLVPTAPSVDMDMIGTGGSAAIMVVRVDNLRLGELPLRSVQFAVGGSEIGAGAGVIGQNVLHYADVEYDIAHGRVGLFKPHGCGRQNLAYWAEGQPLSIIDMADDEGGYGHTTAIVTVNGQRVKAMFDTGAGATTLSRETAARLGIKLDGADVTRDYSRGVGRKIVPTWTVPVADIKIGGEETRNNRLEVSDIGDFDMLIGIDFFLAHRIYVANDQQKIYFTYVGGNFFNPSRKTVRAVDGSGKALELTEKSEEPKQAEDYARRGMARAARGQATEGLVDLDKAVALAPNEPRYLIERARLHRERHEGRPMMADLDRALALKPDDGEALLDRAGYRVDQGEIDAAKADVVAADKALAPAANLRLALADLYISVGDPIRAIAIYSQWIDTHPIDASQAGAHNGRCWARALANVDLPRALADCNTALHTIAHRETILDSRGLVYLRMGNFPAAIADYSAALAIDPKLAWSLYGRGLAKLKSGSKTDGEKDIAAAKALDAKAVERAVSYGMVP